MDESKIEIEQFVASRKPGETLYLIDEPDVGGCLKMLEVCENNTYVQERIAKQIAAGRTLMFVRRKAKT